MLNWRRGHRTSHVPLAWERLLWSGRPGLPARLTRPRERYDLTDFRAVVTRGGTVVAELAVHDLAQVDLRQTPFQRLRGTSTLVLRPRGRGEPVTFTDVARAPQLALIIELLAVDPTGLEADSSLLAEALGPRSSRLLERRWAALAVPAAAVLLATALGGALVARRERPVAATYPADDAIYPGGQKRSRAEIVAFMERDVMPFAREALGPLVGGGDRVTCATCHGNDAEARDWHMPAVRALPRPIVRRAAMERYASDDAQLRNAVYGYLSDDGRQHRMAYMRGVVMPGMARLLHRPPYDFTQTYAYNRARSAFGCYHCHLASESAGSPGLASSPSPPINPASRH